MTSFAPTALLWPPLVCQDYGSATRDRPQARECDRRDDCEHDEVAASLNPDGAAVLLDVAFGHPIALIASALGTPPAGLVTYTSSATSAI